MYFTELKFKMFCNLRDTNLKFQSCLNALVGPGNIDKSAVVEELRMLLAGYDESYPRLDVSERRCLKVNKPT